MTKEAGRSRPSAAPKPGFGRLAGWMFTLAVLLLPALAAGIRLDAPVLASEWGRLVDAEPGPTAGPADRYVRATLDLEAWERALAAAPEAANPAAESPAAESPAAVAPGARNKAATLAVASARRVQVLGLLGCSLLLYLGTTLARNRGRAALACVLFATSAPVAQSGYALRPGTAALMFVLLGLLLLQGLAPPGARRRHHGPTLFFTALLAAGASSLALALDPRLMAAFLAPAIGSGAALLLATRAMWRVMRRRHPKAWPNKAVALRVWPWVLSAFATLALGVWWSQRYPSSLTPGQATLSTPVWTDGISGWTATVMMVLGVLRIAWEVGERVGRRGRLTRPAIWALGLATVFAAGRVLGPEDSLLPAAAAAVFAAEGLAMVLWLGVGLIMVTLRRRAAGRA